MRQYPRWRAYLVVGMAASAVYALLGGSVVGDVLFVLTGAATAAAVFTGIRLHRPVPRLPWLLIGAAVVTFLVGETVVQAIESDGTIAPVPSPADVFFVVAVAAVATGMLLLARTNTVQADQDSLVDTTAVTVAVGLAGTAFLLPLWTNPRSPAQQTELFVLLYPAVDLLLLAAMLRLLLGPGIRATSHRLLLLGTGLLLTADIAYAALYGAGAYEPNSPLNALWLAALVCAGAAALHPSSARSAPEQHDPAAGLTRWRLALLTAAFLCPPVVLLCYPLFPEGQEQLLVALAAGVSILLFLLLAVRVTGLVRELRRTQRQRGYLLDRTVQAREGERMQLAGELHDGPIQRLTFLTIDLELSRRALRRQDVQDGMNMLVSVQGRLTEEIGELRRVMARLRPPLLDEVGLTAALQDHAAEFERRQGVHCRVEADVRTRIDPNLETVLYRVTQEALINVRKYAHATSCVISLTASDTRVGLTVRDDGQGFDPAYARGPEDGHYGLVSMRERVEMTGGECRVETGPGQGVAIIVHFPGPHATGLARTPVDGDNLPVTTQPNQTVEEAQR